MRVAILPIPELDGAKIIGQASIQVEGVNDVLALLVEKDGLKYLAFRRDGKIVAMRWEPTRKPDPEDRGLKEYY